MNNNLFAIMKELPLEKMTNSDLTRWITEHFSGINFFEVENLVLAYMMKTGWELETYSHPTHDVYYPPVRHVG